METGWNLWQSNASIFLYGINDINESRLTENAMNIDAFMGNFEKKCTRNVHKYEEYWKYTLENFYLGSLVTLTKIRVCINTCR